MGDSLGFLLPRLIELLPLLNVNFPVTETDTEFSVMYLPWRRLSTWCKIDYVRSLTILEKVRNSPRFVLTYIPGMF